MIYTSSYLYGDGLEKTMSISGDRGKMFDYNGSYYSKLAPKKEFFDVWRNNIGKVSKIDNNRFYVGEYLKNVLINLDPFQIYDELDEYTLLCYEDNNEFCHRHIVACWLEDTLGIITPEIKFVDGKITRVQRPKYIKELYKESKHILKR